VAVLNAVEVPSYWIGGWSNDYQTLVNALNANGFYAQAVTNDQIIAGVLNNFNVFVMVDNVPSDKAVPYVYNFWLDGGGIVAFDSSACFLCYAGILPSESAGSNGYGVYWDYNTQSTAKISTVHPVTVGYTVGQLITGQMGDAEYFASALAGTSASPYYTKLAEDLSISSHAYVSAYQPPISGKVVHIWDNHHWVNTNLRLMILNAMEWAAAPLYQHELRVILSAPTRLGLGGSSRLNATVYNVGLSEETNVTVSLIINWSTVANEVIPTMQSGSSYTLSYLWTPSSEETYNVTAYVQPVLGEVYLADNVATKFIPVADTTPPSTIVDLTASNPTASSITLTWTAPGDDGMQGTATGYLLKFSITGSINWTNWNNMTTYIQSWRPLPAGSIESHVVTGLIATTTYWFAIEAYDEVPNFSGISNSPAATTTTPWHPPSYGFYGMKGYIIMTNATNFYVTGSSAWLLGGSSTGLLPYIYLDMQGDITPGKIVLVRIFYDRNRAQQLGINESTLQFYTWNVTSLFWQPIQGVDQILNSTDGTITMYISHFSYYAVFGSPPSNFEAPRQNMILLSVIGIVSVIIVAVALISISRRKKSKKQTVSTVTRALNSIGSVSQLTCEVEPSRKSLELCSLEY